jgi:hypothetical protein
MQTSHVTFLQCFQECTLQACTSNSNSSLLNSSSAKFLDKSFLQSSLPHRQLTSLSSSYNGFGLKTPIDVIFIIISIIAIT